MRPILLIATLLRVLAMDAQLLFDRIGVEQGLPSDEVHAVFEDRDGFVWVGTTDGLARLEGTRVRTFHHDPVDSSSLAHDQVNCIDQAPDGTLWFATMSGLSRFVPRSGTFVNVRVTASGNDALQANRMRQVVAVGDTLLWVVTEAGLFRGDPRNGRLHSVQDRPPGEGPAGRMRSNSSLFWDAPRATIWAATARGIASWDAATDRWTDHRNSTMLPWSDLSATGAPVVHDQALWYMRHGPYTLFRYDLRTGDLTALPDVEEQPNRFELRCQTFDAEGRHWIATWTHRLFVRAPNGPWSEVRPDGIGSPSTRAGCLRTMRSGVFLLGTAGGLAVLRPGAQAHTVLPFDASPFAVSVIRAWGEDTLLVGTEGGGVHLVDHRTGASTALRVEVPGAPDDVRYSANLVHAFGATVDGRVLVCTGRGLAELDVHAATLRPADGITALVPNGAVSAFTFAERTDDALWLGTWQRGLWRVDPRTGEAQRVDTADGPWGRLPNLMLLSWLSTADGGHWAGLNNGGGLARFHAGRWSAVMNAAGAHVGGVVRCMAQGPDGLLWLGTHEHGLVVHDPAGVSERYIGRRDGLPGTRILALCATRDGTIWAATPQGLARRPPGAATFAAMLLPSALDGQAFSRALVELPDGRIAIGVGPRILLHDPLRERHGLPPVPVFTAHRVGDATVLGAPADLVLEPDRKALMLELGGLGVMPGEVPLFRYRVLPADTAWKEIGAAKRIDLFDLDPGSHQLVVQMSLDGVHWAPEEAAVAVQVLPPFHATWWFRALALLAIGAAAFAGFKAYLHARLRRQREAFEREQAVLAERMRIAGDMHDDLGAGLSALKLRSEMALRVEQDPAKRAHLGSLARTAGELIGSMRQIIWAMNADQAELADLVAYTTNHARRYCDEHGIRLRVDVEERMPLRTLSAEQRRNIFLVVKEALHNVVKHAAARQVRLVMAWREGALDVRIADDGPGPPAHAEATEGNGLRNMGRRIAALGGTLTLERSTDPDHPGACLRFRVPMEAPPNLRSIGRPTRPEDLRSA
ncbi:MAG: hypothetical protein IPM49_09900 [Flavobacteriales bacterium]|nr:hypothetical protein [Flavobacteriales bacterium]